MKNILFFTLIFSFVASGSTPPPDFKKYMVFDDFCDACGCSASGGGMGFSSMIDQNFVGIRYFHQNTAAVTAFLITPRG